VNNIEEGINLCRDIVKKGIPYRKFNEILEFINK
jgi:hypothetical protein